MCILVGAFHVVSFDFHGLRALRFCSLRSQLFLKEKIKIEKNKKESLCYIGNYYILKQIF
jgi:hypothetical protein